MTKDEIAQFIDKKAEELGEHFEAVQILVSWNEDGMTKGYFSGAGNFYARQGMAHEFIEKDKAQTHAREMDRWTR